MDVRKFVNTLEEKISSELKMFEIKIEVDNLPTSVKFLVVSDEFAPISRVKRISFINNILTESFGSPMAVMAIGGCLTVAEYNQISVEGENDDIQHPGDINDGSAAHSL